MPLVPSSDAPTIPLRLLEPEGLPRWLEGQEPHVAAWVAAMGFEAGLGEVLALPGPDGSLAGALLGWGTAGKRARDRFHLAAGAAHLPAGRYALDAAGLEIDAGLEALGWLLGEYRFTRYRAAQASRIRELVCPEGVDAARVQRAAEAAALAQDLINTPARDLGPEALEAAFADLGRAHGAEVRVVRGMAALREGGFPLIAAVGAAAAEAPRLLDMVWGREGAPRVTLVGKGVCFDTGGLNIKPGASMGLMKKDM
ncbi:MAG TPA: leucyl aminopeptidase family protein, partial [Amaricoccus sp.]|nr:leucyl aminopeptidase family protein [Amaricoccus sp.]